MHHNWRLQRPLPVVGRTATTRPKRSHARSVVNVGGAVSVERWEPYSDQQTDSGHEHTEPYLSREEATRQMYVEYWEQLSNSDHLLILTEVRAHVIHQPVLGRQATWRKHGVNWQSF